MFNISLKKEALRIHKNTLTRYNNACESMRESCDQLYSVRRDSVELIQFVQGIINSIADTPKFFETEAGEIGQELRKFHETEEFARKAYDEEIKTGVNMTEGILAGLGVAAMAPTALMSIATTFGTASTGTAISALSGAAAEKAAIAWLGRTFAGFAVKGGAGMAAGNALLALAGPLGWAITAIDIEMSVVDLTRKNKKLADQAVEEAKEIERARESLDEATEKIRSLKTKTELLYTDMNEQKSRIAGFMNSKYIFLSSDEKYFLGSLVNNTLSLCALLNETII